jgi:hypothetical protein
MLALIAWQLSQFDNSMKRQKHVFGFVLLIMAVPWRRKPGRFCDLLCALLQPRMKTLLMRFAGDLLNTVGWS